MISARVMLAFSKLNNAGGCYSIDLEKALCAVVEAAEKTYVRSYTNQRAGRRPTHDSVLDILEPALKELEQRLRECGCE